MFDNNFIVGGSMLKINMYLHLYSLLLLSAVLVSNHRSTFKKISDVLYLNLIRTTMIIIVVDFLSRFDGLNQSYYVIFNHVGNFLLYLLTPLISIVWFLYLDYKIYGDSKHLKKRFIYLLVLFFINAIFTIGTPFFGWFYKISEENIYSRGPLFFIHSLINITLVIMSIILLLKNHKRLDKAHYSSYLFFVLMPALGLILQILIYGIAVTLSLTSISIVVVHINVQNQRINLDYLTNLFNRRQLDYYIQEKMNDAIKRQKKFAIILIDLDNFKLINDIHGHFVGDEALRKTADILRDSVTKDVFVARFGGDEFYIVCDICEDGDVKKLLVKISDNFSTFNAHNEIYTIEYSYGYVIYDDMRHNSLVELHQEVDHQMYQMKKEHHKAYNVPLQ